MTDHSHESPLRWRRAGRRCRASVVRVGAAPLIAVALLGLVLVGTGGHAIADDVDAGVVRGRQTYVRVGCYECHGYEAQGGAGPRLAPGPIPFEALKAFVRGTTGDMPAYAQQVLSDADLADIFTFLSSVPRPKSPDSISALKGLN